MRFRKFYLYLFLAGLIAVPVGSKVFAQKDSKGSIETKIALESSMENKLRQVLTKITGTDKLVITVNVQLAEEKNTAVKKKDEAEDADFILPGVPIKEAASDKKVGDAVREALGEDTRTLINKMTCTIILDKGVSASVEKVVREVSAEILGIDPERGDKLDIKKMDFQQNPFYWGSLLYPPNIYWVLAVSAAVILSFSTTFFMFGPFKVFTKDLVSSAVMAAKAFQQEVTQHESEESAFGGSGQRGAELQTVDDVKDREKATFDGKEPLFSFINEKNIKSLLFLLQKEPPKNIAIVINYLPANLASQVLNSLPAETQSQITMFLAKVQELDPSEVDGLEVRLNNRIGFLTGGAQKVIQILDYSDEKFKKAFLQTLSTSDKGLFDQISGSLFDINSLSTLDASSLQTVIRTISPGVFSQVLKTLDSESQERIMGALPQGAAARIKQEMDLAKPFNAQRIATEKRRIIAILRRMEAQGLLEKQS
jgi:hypothetical protein